MDKDDVLKSVLLKLNGIKWDPECVFIGIKDKVLKVDPYEHILRIPLKYVLHFKTLINNDFIHKK